MDKKLIEYRIKAAKIIDEYVKKHGYSDVKHKSDIRQLLVDEIGEMYVMFQEADMCYNKTNKANLATYAKDVLLFEACEQKGYFKLLGQNYPYTGDVIWTKKSEPNEVVGHWENGKLNYWGDSIK